MLSFYVNSVRTLTDIMRTKSRQVRSQNRALPKRNSVLPTGFLKNFLKYHFHNNQKRSKSRPAVKLIFMKEMYRGNTKICLCFMTNETSALDSLGNESRRASFRSREMAST